MSRSTSAIGDLAIAVLQQASGAPEPPLHLRMPEHRFQNERDAFSRFSVHGQNLDMSEPMQASARERASARLAILYEYAESPIERAIAPWLLSEWYGPRCFDVPPSVYAWRERPIFPAGDVVIVPQFSFMGMRIDFAVVASIGKRKHIVTLECDGADFHHPLTDIKRDGILASWGMQTVRATGKEIYSDPQRVSLAVARAVIDAIDQERGL